jgi:hypothetical protein
VGNRFASGKNAIAECDRCAFRFKLTRLKKEVIKTKTYNLLVCPQCWDPDQPQLQLGMYPVDDPQGIRDPRPDISYVQSGNTGLQIVDTTATTQNAVGLPSEGSRDFQWGWNPVGGARGIDDGLTPNNLVLRVQIGTVTVVVA